MINIYLPIVIYFEIVMYDFCNSCAFCPFQKPAGKLDPKIASKILPGAKNFQDVEKWMEKQKKERMDQLKKKNNW